MFVMGTLDFFAGASVEHTGSISRDFTRISFGSAPWAGDKGNSAPATAAVADEEELEKFVGRSSFLADSSYLMAAS
jgi:hypothetical protein